MGLYSGFDTQVNTGIELLRVINPLITASCKVPTDLVVTIMCLLYFTIPIIAEIHSRKVETG